MSKLYLQINEAGYITGWASMGHIENGIEVDDSLEDSLDASLMGCQKYVDGKVVTDCNLKEAKEERSNASNEISEINNWFVQYDRQVSQYQRAVRLGDVFDKDIAELDAEAVKKQMRMRELQRITKNEDHKNIKKKQQW